MTPKNDGGRMFDEFLFVNGVFTTDVEPEPDELFAPPPPVRTPQPVVPTPVAGPTAPTTTGEPAAALPTDFVPTPAKPRPRRPVRPTAVPVGQAPVAPPPAPAPPVPVDVPPAPEPPAPTTPRVPRRPVRRPIGSDPSTVERVPTAVTPEPVAAGSATAPERRRPRPSQLVTTPPAVGGCMVCGRGPTTALVVRRHVGLIILMRFAHAKGVFCREHGEAVAHEYLRRTLVEGWWGIFSFFLNWYAIFVDIKALRQVRRLDPPVGEVRADTAGMPALPEDALAAASETPEERRGRTSVLKVVAASVGLGVIIQILGFVFARNENDPISRRITIGDLLVLILYGVVALLVARTVGAGNVRPRSLEGSRGRAIASGLATGLAAALLVIAFISLLDGKWSTDRNVLMVLAEHNTVNIALIFVTLSILAPLIEETLFRGLLVESLRSRGRWSAILGGAVAFALWHLNPFALRYYILMGILLGFIYWRFGLTGSITAHATFNTALFVVGVLLISGSAQTIDRAGLHMTLPASWSLVKDAPAAIDVAAESRTGAALAVIHADGGSLFNTSQPYTAPPGAQAVHDITIAEGKGTRFRFVAPDGHLTDVVVLQRGTRRWVFTLLPQGSAQAQRDFDRMLETLKITI